MPGRRPTPGAPGMRRCWPPTSTSWSAVAPGANCRPASGYRSRLHHPRPGQKGGRTRRSEPRGPGQAGFQDAHPVGREGTAPSRRHLSRQHPRQRRAEAHDRGSPLETRPSPGRVLQAPAPTRGQSLRPCRPAQMAAMEAHRRPYRPQRHRVQRTIRAPSLGYRAHHVVAIRLTQTQPSLRARHPRNDLALLGLAAALCCYKRLVRLTT